MRAQVRPADAAAPEPALLQAATVSIDERTVPLAEFDAGSAAAAVGASTDANTDTDANAGAKAANGVIGEPSLPVDADDERTQPLAPQIALPSPPAPAPGISFDAVRLRQLHRGAPYTLLLSVFSCVAAATVLAGRTAWPVLAAWLGGGLLLSVLMGLDHRRTRAKLDDAAALQRWEWRLAAALLLQGGLWLLLFAATPLHSSPERTPLQLLAFATTFTATVVFATSLRSFLALVPLTALGQLLWMVRSQPGLAEAIFVSALYAVVLATGLLSFRRVLLAGVEASRERRALMAEQAALFDGSLVGMAHVREGIFVRVNRELARIYGLPQEEIEGASTRIVYPDEASWQQAAAAAQTRHPADRFSYERAYNRPDGKRSYLRVQARVIIGSEHRNDRIYSVIDITESRKAEKVLAAREQAYRSLAETYRVITSTAPGLVWATDAAGAYTFLGERGCIDIYGVAAAEAAGKSLSGLVRDPLSADDIAAFDRMLAGEMLRDHVSEIVRHDGRHLFISTSGGPLYDAEGRIAGACGISIDVSGRERDAAALQGAQQMMTSAVESLSDGFALFGADGCVSLCNHRFAELMEAGKPMEDMIGMHISDVVRYRLRHGQVIPPEYLGDEAAWIAARMRHHQEANGVPSQYQLSDGRWIQTTKRRTPDGGVVGIYTDITALKRTEEAVRVLAQHDALTGLPNRRLLEDRLAQALTRAKRESSLVGLLLIDLDGFKPVNDRHGHRAGDEALRVVAQRLRDCVRAADTVARFGGDEFVIVLDTLASAADAGAVAAKVIEALARPIEPLWMPAPAQVALQIGGSVGIGIYPQDGTEPDTLMRHADAAMYKAKEAGRGRFVYHSPPA